MILAAKIVGAIFFLAFLLLLFAFGMVFALVYFPLRIFFALFGFAIVIILLWALIFTKRGSKWRKGLLIAAGSTAIAVSATVGGLAGYEAYLSSIRLVDNSNIDTNRYLPFREDSKIARLDHVASLQFGPLDELPRVDGAAALFPMYSSFVSAVYPHNIHPLNHQDGPFYYTNTISSNFALYEGSRDIIFGMDAKDYANNGHTADEIYNEPMGREGFIFFTNAKNPVDSLTQDQIRSIYSGKITNWAEVGGNNEAIRPYQRNRGSGSQTGMLAFMGDVPLIDPPGDEYRFALMSGIISAIADYYNHPGAIGYSYYYYASSLKANNDIKILAVDGITPSHETIGSEDYPLTSNFYMNVRKDHITENTRKLMDWILSDEGQELVSKSGYAPVKKSS